MSSRYNHKKAEAYWQETWNQKNIFNLLDSLYDACYEPAKNDLDQIREIAEEC